VIGFGTAIFDFKTGQVVGAKPLNLAVDSTLLRSYVPMNPPSPFVLERKD
jgi:hypothetical protein